MRRRKVVYPPPKTATKGGAATPEARSPAANRVVSIDVTAIRGREGVVPGMRVEIAAGLYAGEPAVVESMAGGVIPAVVVRTDAGRTRRVRVIDLVPVARRQDASEPDSA